MAATKTARILFSGYAPVHFICFDPVYRLLADDPRVQIELSGGFKREDEFGNVYFDQEGFFEPLGVDSEHVVSPERLKEEDYDVVVCSHLSDSLFPRYAKKSVQITHGVSFKNLSVRLKALRYDYICLAGRYHAERYISQGLVHEDGSHCLVTGFAKVDPLAKTAPEQNELLEGFGLKPGLPTLLLAPTGDKHNALETWGEELVRKLALAGRYNLLIKPHDHPKNDFDWFAALEKYEGPHLRLVRGHDVVPCLQASDLLLTDASSVAVEYTLLDRPIVFLDVPKLLKRVAKRAPALDLDSYGRKIGRVVEQGQDVVAAIDNSLANPDREGELRRKMASHVFHDPGRAGERVAGVVLHAAGLEEGLPGDVQEIVPPEVSEALPSD